RRRPARDRQRPAPLGGTRTAAAEDVPPRRAGPEAAGPVLSRAGAARRVAPAGGGRGADAPPGAARRAPSAHSPSPSPSPSAAAPGLTAASPPLIGRRSGTDHAAVRDRHADHARGGRQRAAATARGARARRGVRGRDPEEVRDRGGLPGVRAGGRTDRIALPARRRGARARRERRGVHDLLYRLE